jgi:hypothetical protein
METGNLSRIFTTRFVRYIEKNIWTQVLDPQITQISQISGMDRWKYPLRGNPNKKHSGQWETLRDKNKLACFCSSRVPIVSSDPDNSPFKLPCDLCVSQSETRVKKSFSHCVRVFCVGLWPNLFSAVIL